MAPWGWTVAGGLALPVTLIYLYTRLFGKRTLAMRNKVVLITGASSGLGEACGHVFYRAGCKVILAGRRQEELQRVKDDIVNSTSSEINTDQVHPPEVVVMDITDDLSIKSKLSAILQVHGTIDILINNAGVSYRGEIEHTDLSVYRKLMDVNFFGQVSLTKEVLPVMLKQNGGTIVAISSMQGKLSIPYRSAYSSSKHALQAFCDCLRAEVGDRNVNICVISPGYIRTNLSLNAVQGDGSSYGVMDSTTASGMSPQRVAEAVLQAVVYKQKDVVLSSFTHRLAIYIRTLLPSLFFWLMLKRARKQKAASEHIAMSGTQ